MSDRLGELWEHYDDLVLGIADGSIAETREDIESEAIADAAEGLLAAAGVLGMRSVKHEPQVDWPCIGGPMAGARLPLRPAYKVIRLDGAPEGEYRRTQVDLGRWAYIWARR